MKRFIKKVAILLALMMVGFGSAYAQEAGDMAVGLNIVFTPKWVFSYAYKNGAYTNNAGAGAKFQYNVTTPIRVEGIFNTFFSGDNLGLWDLSVNAHYLIPATKKLNVYSVTGLDFMKYRSWGKVYGVGGAIIVDMKVAGKHTVFGVNIGGGIECKLSKKVSLQGDLRYIIGFDNSIFSEYYKTNRLMISIGAVYKFKNGVARKQESAQR